MAKADYSKCTSEKTKSAGGCCSLITLVSRLQDGMMLLQINCQEGSMSPGQMPASNKVRCVAKAQKCCLNLCSAVKRQMRAPERTLLVVLAGSRECCHSGGEVHVQSVPCHSWWRRCQLTAVEQSGWTGCLPSQTACCQMPAEHAGNEPAA